MALKKTVQTNQGFEAIDAYHRVEMITIEGKNKISFYVRSYKDVTKPFFAEQLCSCRYDLQGANPIHQAYEHLKELTEFVDSIDC